MPMIPIEKIPDLTNEEFMKAYVSGELNSLDLTAREYLERKEIVKEEMKQRAEKGLSTLNQLLEVPNVEEEKNFRAHLILYAAEGEVPNFIVCPDEFYARSIIDMFKRTGKVEVQDVFSREMIEKPVQTVAYTVTQEMYKYKGTKQVPN